MIARLQDTDTFAQAYWTSEEAWIGSRRPLYEASYLPAECYTGQTFFDQEQEHVFARSWVCVGLLDELKPDGRALVRTVAGRSVIISRNAKGILRAFRNSCRHRGTQLLEEDCDLGSLIRCPYHRWGYDRDGALVATPHFTEAGIDGFNPSDFGLLPVPVIAWQCLLFICLSEEPPALEEWFGDLDERLSGYRLDAWHSRLTIALDIAANWKLVSENFQEYYHLHCVHPELSKVSRSKDHYRYQGRGMYCGQTTTPLSSDERDDWMTMPPAKGLSDSDLASGRFFALFPNVLLSVLPNHVFVMRLEPLAPGLTRETCTWLLPSTSQQVADADFAVTRDFWLTVNNEDIDIVQRGQIGLTTGGYKPGRLSPRFEEPLHRFHNMLADRLTGVNRVPAGDNVDGQSLYGTAVDTALRNETDSQERN